MDRDAAGAQENQKLIQKLPSRNSRGVANGPALFGWTDHRQWQRQDWSYLAVGPPTGKLKVNCAPSPSIFSALMVPECASMIDDTIASPMPTPFALVLKN